MAPNTFKLESLDTFSTIDKTLFLRKGTPLLSDVESSIAEKEDVFSYSHLEKQLLADAKRREEEEAKLTEESEAKAEDEYWGWCNDETAQERRSRENRQLLEQILQQEEARIFLSAEETTKRLIEASSEQESKEMVESDNIDSEYWTWRSDQDERNLYFSADKVHQDLVRESTERSQRTSQNDIHSRSNRHDFWDWSNDESQTEKEQREKQELLKNILLEEELRKDFLAHTIETRLLEESKTTQIQPMITSNEASGSYWEW